MQYDFEKLAYKNSPMPNGLSTSDQFMFLGLRFIYNEYNHKRITKEQAQKEKIFLEKSYSLLKSKEKIFDQSCELRNRVEKKGYDLLEALKADFDVKNKAKDFYNAFYENVPEWFKENHIVFSDELQETPIDKAKAFLDKYIPLLQETQGSEEYWQEVTSMAEYFKSEQDKNNFVAIFNLLETMYKTSFEDKK